MDSFQSPSPNDQRRFSATELAIGVNPAELNAPWPDAASQPTPVNQTTLVPSAKTLELMRQLEALAHEIALVSRGDSSNQCIKVEEGSNFSAGLQLVEPSIRVSPCDQMASDSPLFGRRTNLTLAGFFIAARGWLASSRTLLGRSSDTLAGLFIAVRNWLASRRPSFGKPSATLANLLIAALIGVAAAFVWQSQRVSTETSPNDVAVAEKQSGVTPVGQLSLQDAPPQIASATHTAPASTAPGMSSELVRQLEAMGRDLVVLQRRVEELAGKQEHLAAAQEQLAAKQEQMDQTIAKPQAVKRNTNNKMSSPPRRNAPPGPEAQALSVPRPEPNPKPPLSVLPDRR
jgi:hypothetical protein